METTVFTRRKLVLGLTFFAALFGVSSAGAQTGSYPNRPIKIIVPYAPGGLPDTMGRAVAQHMSQAFGQQVIVDNRSGAGGLIAAEALAKSAPDGYTLLVVDPAHVAINPVIYKKLPYNPAKDFAPVSMIGVSPLFLVAHPSVEAKNFKEFVATVKANPKKYSYGSTGNGSLHHMAMESMKASLGLELLHVPYRGTGQAAPAVVAGEVSVIFAGLPSMSSYLRSGHLKVLAANTLKRSPQAPDVPTIAELGIPGYSFPAEIGLVAPAGTPRDIIFKLSQAVAEATRRPEIRERFATLGIDPVGSTPEEFKASIEQMVPKYEEAGKAAGIAGSQ
jgi:tripartite-type tricarboxylate transporter receptor subunit TctC